MPPWPLPENKTQSGFRTRSTMNGGSDEHNELRFEDKIGEEQIWVQAQKDLDTLVKNDETRTVEHDRTTTITNNDTRTVTDGDDTHTIESGHHTLTVNRGDIRITADQGGISIKAGMGAINIEAGQSITLTVGGNSVELGASGITIKGTMLSLSGDATAELKSPTTTVKGDGMLTLKGGVTMIN
jgi:type VI secretion system secreted protein VgrG